METTQHAEDPGTADGMLIWRMGFLVTACAVLAFLPALACGFVIPDDKQNFLSNLVLDYPWGQKLAWAWTTRWMQVYQPLWWMLVIAEHAGLGPQTHGLSCREPGLARGRDRGPVRPHPGRAQARDPRSQGA